MSEFGPSSRRHLSTCHEHIQLVMGPVVAVYDCSVIWGFRGQARQQRAFLEGHSQKQWPDSRHNTNPSLAIDVVPYPIDWDDIDRFIELSWVIKGSASALDLPLEWGGDWSSFKDYAHWQLPKDY